MTFNTNVILWFTLFDAPHMDNDTWKMGVKDLFFGYILDYKIGPLERLVQTSRLGLDVTMNGPNNLQMLMWKG